MLTVEKSEKPPVLIVKLSGVVDDTVDLETLIGTLPAELHVYCGGVNRVNSVGVKTWMKYFQSLQLKRIIVKYFECSSIIVEQINLVRNFACGAQIISLHVPYACAGCSQRYNAIFPTSTLLTQNCNAPDMKCPKCGGVASFDDVPEEYFHFLSAKG